MTDKLSERLEALAEKATKGPWETGSAPEENYLYAGGSHIACISSPVDNGMGGDNYRLEDGSESASNAALFVELVNALPTIIEALKAKDL